MTQKAKDGFVMFGAFLIYVIGMLVYLTMKSQMIRKLAQAAWCFLLTGVVIVGGFVAIGYFIKWMVGGP